MHAHLLAAAQNNEGIVQLPQVDIPATDAAHSLLLKESFEISPGQALYHVLLARGGWQVQITILRGHDP